MTTAFLALRLLLPGEIKFQVLPFDEIIPAVASGKFDAGLIIHEGQLTFQNQGLHLIVDLGVWWQEKTGLPLPLGGNVVRRDLGPDLIRRISSLLKQSIQPLPRGHQLQPSQVAGHPFQLGIYHRSPPTTAS